MEAVGPQDQQDQDDAWTLVDTILEREPRLTLSWGLAFAATIIPADMTAKPVLLAFLLSVWFPATLAAQDSSKPKPDSARAGMMDDHMMGPWKEMNAFHRIMAATWHPAAQKNDLAPLKTRAKELVSAAESWAASTPPVMPASCGDSTVVAAAKKVASETKALVGLVESNVDDTRLKSALKEVHDTFEVAEKGCAGHG